MTLALPMAAYLARLTRASLLESLRSGYVRSARARGLGGCAGVLAPRAAPGAAAGGQLPRSRDCLHRHRLARGGERVRRCPGTGRYLVQGAIDRDYPLVLGMVVVYGTLTLVLNFLSDLLYGWLDPAARHG